MEKVSEISYSNLSDISEHVSVCVYERELLVPSLSKGKTLYSLAYEPPYPCQGKPKRGLVIRSCDRGYTFDSSQVGIRRNCQSSGFIAVIERLSPQGLMRALPRDAHYVGLYLGQLLMGLNHEPHVASRAGLAERGPNPGPGS